MIQAIETRYKGYRFRSRLEARWAVFFDACGLQWEYEPEGYDLGPHGLYLPDFFLRLPMERPSFPNAGYVVEIKPVIPAAAAFEKLRALSMMTKHTCWMFIGVPGEQREWGCHHNGHEGWWEDFLKPTPGDGPFARTIEELDPVERLEAFCLTRWSSAWKKGRTAVACARAARFEHGETL